MILDTEVDEDDADEFLIEEAAKDPLTALEDPATEVGFTSHQVLWTLILT